MSTILESKIFSSIRNLSFGRNEIQFGIITTTVMISLIASYWGSLTILILLIAAVMGIPFLNDAPRLVDLAPTILNALNVAKGAAMEGSDLMS